MAENSNVVIQFITDLINGVGFPIAMVVYFIYDKMKVTSKLASAVEKITEAINNQNTTLQKLIIKLGCEDMENE